MGAKYIIVACLLCANFICSAQKERERDSILQSINFVPQVLTTNEYIHYQLPPLDSLFENAKTNPRLKAIQSSIEAARYDLKLTKREWWQYLSLHAGYTYGILGTYTDQETQYTPLSTVYTGASQSSWSVGANISIPFNHLLGQRTSIKKQKQLVQNVEYTQQVAFDEIKNEIIELYCNIQYQLKLLQLAIETLTLYNAEYQVAVLDYINNKNNTNRLLSDIKNSQKDAKIEYEKIINELNILFFKLELISNMNLRNR